MAGSAVASGGGSLEFPHNVLRWEAHAWQGVEASPCMWLAEFLREGGFQSVFQIFGATQCNLYLAGLFKDVGVLLKSLYHCS